MLLGRCQRCRRGIPVLYDLTLDEGRKGVVAADLQRPALGRLPIVVDLLAFLRGVPNFVPVVAGVEVTASPEFVVYGALAEAQLPRDLPDGYLVAPHGLQLVTFRLCHVVLLSHLPLPPQ